MEGERILGVEYESAEREGTFFAGCYCGCFLIHHGRDWVVVENGNWKGGTTVASVVMLHLSCFSSVPVRRAFLSWGFGSYILLRYGLRYEERNEI